MTERGPVRRGVHDLGHGFAGLFPAGRWWMLAAALALLSCDPAAAQKEDDGQVWFPFYLTTHLSERVLGYAEVNPRFGNNMSEIEQLLLRPAAGYQVTPRLSLWQGYAWVNNYQPSFRAEHRSFQQAVYTASAFQTSLMSRTRFEQRWIQRTTGTAFRAREMIRLSIPMDASKRWSLVLYDELFVNLNSVSGGPQSGFDQNRAFIGINRVLSPHVNVDVGYQNLALNTDEPGLIGRHLHIILIQTFLSW